VTASSFHLWWEVPASVGGVVEARATLEVRVPPAVNQLYFWALQVSFEDRGRQFGGAHTGLQWNPGAPEGAINWGGYHPASVGGELAGTTSTLPPVPGDGGPNTRRWPWMPGRSYRLRVWSPAAGAWRAEVADLVDGRTTVIRDLLVPATTLTSPVVWTEVFARCRDPLTEARWSGLEVVDRDGRVAGIKSVNVTYQAPSAGGCNNTLALAEGDTLVQRTGLDGPRPRQAASTLRLRA
jgi:hypothetical protein